MTPAARLNLSPRCWYGLELLGPLAGEEARADTWTAATPIFVTAVTPMKTGGSVLEVEFVRVIAAFQPTITKLVLKVVHRGERVILGTGEGWRGTNDLFAITPLDMDWIGRLCPRVIERYAIHTLSWYDGAEPSDPRQYLEHVFGTAPEQMSQHWTAKDAPWSELLTRQPRALMPYQREWSGMDAWLLLRPELPNSMDDKWLIRAVDRGPVAILWFGRSWTGFPLYELTLQKNGDKLTTDCATVSLNERQRKFGTPEQEAAVLDWLIDSFLLARRRELEGIFDFAPIARAKRAWDAHQRAAGQPAPDWSAARRTSPRRDRDDASRPTLPQHPDLTDYGIEDVPVGPKLSSYPLHTQAWREAFLQRLMDVGGEVLLEATSHVWELLMRPKAARAIAIGLAAGVGGKGKKAIYNALSAFMDEWIGDMTPPAVPAPGNVDAVHEAYMDHWAKEKERERAVVMRYAALLGGEAAELVDVTPAGVVIKGPWLAERDEPFVAGE